MFARHGLVGRFCCKSAGSYEWDGSDGAGNRGMARKGCAAQRIHQNDRRSFFVTSEFSQLGLHPQLVQTVAALGYESPTPIQSAIIPLMLEGKDVIGQAQTGTGKTAAFALPILHNLNGSRGRNIQGLVLAPTRELALQVANAMHGYGKAREVRGLPVYGGTPYSRQIRRLTRGVDIGAGSARRM